MTPEELEALRGPKGEQGPDGYMGASGMSAAETTTLMYSEEIKMALTLKKQGVETTMIAKLLNKTERTVQKALNGYVLKDGNIRTKSIKDMIFGA